MQRAAVSRVAVVGTSALRDAEGAHDFLDAAESILGERPRVIAGEEEAALSFVGTLSGLPIAGAVTVFDIGGGSTEIIFGEARVPSHAVHAAYSLDVGSVRLLERHLHGDPPTAVQLEQVRRDIQEALATLPPARPGRVVGVAGTVTTLAAIEAELDPYDGAVVHGSDLSRARVTALATRLAALSNAERRALRGLDVKRADVIVSGAWIACEVLDWCGAGELIVSDRGVRWGLVHRLLTPTA
jgi:exopolyphosphatase/guanosine-5'-triphosphate,3'-diphosphate pyrophosphatase